MDMLVTIQDDEKTAVCTKGNYYEIAGLLIKKDKGRNDEFYDTKSAMFKGVCHGGHTSEAIIVTGNKIHLT